MRTLFVVACALCVGCGSGNGNADLGKRVEALEKKVEGLEHANGVILQIQQKNRDIQKYNREELDTIAAMLKEITRRLDSK